jgi:CheY-like chemotaxis protein
MNMPVMNGWRLAAEIHNDKTINTARLILMAPQGLMGADTKMTLLKWFKAYINKPIKRRGLADTINAAFREPEGPESLGELEAVADAGAAPAPIPAKPLILITEDHPVNRKLFAMIIDKLGYPSILAGDGLEALEQTQAHPEVGLIFMDIQMPRMNGYEAAENLRKQGFDKPIIAVTAGAFPDEEARCLSAGMDDMVIKPFKRPDIEKSLLKWIGGRGGAKAAPKSGEASAMPLVMPIRAAPAGAEPAAEIFSPAELLDTFMGNDDMALSFLHRFVTRTAAQIEGIPGLKEREDWDSARREAHSIKGAAYTMTGKELGTAAARLEGAFKNRDQSEMDAAYGPLAESFGRFRIKAGAFLKSRDFTPAPDPPAAARGSPSEAETE